jgi:hypothetical protein
VFLLQSTDNRRNGGEVNGRRNNTKKSKTKGESMYKLTRPDGYDFFSGTINYRDAIGTIIRVTKYDPPERGSCGRGLHASRNPNDCFVGAKIPCAAFRVKGVEPLAKDKQKTRYQALRVIEEITDLDTLFGWKYSEVVNLIHPFKIPCPKITATHIALVAVEASVWDFVWDSVWDSVRDSVWDSVRDSVRDSLRVSVEDSLWDSVEASVEAFVWAYIGSFFPNIKIWKYASKTKEYPYQSCVDLWRMGLVPSHDGKTWRLHGGPEGKIVWEED